MQLNGRLLVLLFFFFFFLSCSSQDEYVENYVIINDIEKKDTVFFSYDHFMNLSPSASSSQGAACYGDFFFQGFAGNAIIDIYDLKKKEKIAKINNPYRGKNTHANSICFGSKKYDSEDFFPLLYISSGYTSKIEGIPCSFIYIYRIVKKETENGGVDFSMEYLNKIILKDMGTWTEGVIDNDNDVLWIKYEPNGTSGEYRYASFPVPNFEKEDVTLTPNDALTDFSIGVQPFSSSNQGHLYYKDRILLVSGTSPSMQKLAFISINTKSLSREFVVDIAKLGFREEPESICCYGDDLMIGSATSLYKVSFNVVKP